MIPDDELRRSNLAEQHRTSERLADAAELLLGMRTWVSPCEARAIISAIESVHWQYAEMLSATSAQQARRLRDRVKLMHSSAGG